MKHGARHTYEDLGCRCPECTEAKRIHDATRYVRSRHTLSSGTPRRPQDLDWVAVERACRGDMRVRLNRVEMLAVFAWMDAHRYTSRQIAERLGITDRTVQRWRAKDRETPVQEGDRAA